MKRIINLFVLLIVPGMLWASNGWFPVRQITVNDVQDQKPSIDIGKDGRPILACNEIVPNKKYDIFVFNDDDNIWRSVNITSTYLISDYQPVIKSDKSGDLHVFYLSRLANRNNKLYVFYSCFTQGAWSEPTCISLNKPSQAPESRPVVAVDSKNNLHVVFHDDDGKLWYLNKTGNQWNKPEEITAASDSINWYPSIAVDMWDRIHMVYLGGTQGDYSVKYMVRNSKGWENPVTAVSSQWKPWHPVVAVSETGVVHIAFSCDEALTRNIAYTKSQKTGWMVPERLINDSAENDFPTIVLDKDENVHIAYHGGVGGDSGPYTIYYSNNINKKFIKPYPIVKSNIFFYEPAMISDREGYGWITYYGFDGNDTELFLQKTQSPLNKMPKQPSGEVSYINYPDRKNRYLPPLDLNYIPAQAVVLKGKKITISPGHGGLAHLAEYRYGATNSREDEFNFGVAQYLRKYLEESGATVYMCRTTDVDVDIINRPAMALENGSDLFVSIHHNAFDFYSNYGSVYFHGEPDDNPESLDMARFVNQNISDYMNIPTVGVMSDYYSYWGSGYGELRGLQNKIPGILGEGSHFYCFAEEEQLRNVDYLRRQAYAYFRGLVSYYSLENPVAKLLEPLEPASNKPNVKILIDEGNVKGELRKIVPSSVKLIVDGKSVVSDYNWRSGILTWTPEVPLSSGNHVLEVFCTNYDKINLSRTRFTITVQ